MILKKAVFSGKAGRMMEICTAADAPFSSTVAFESRGNFYLFANGTAYSHLCDLARLTSECDENQLFYFPLDKSSAAIFQGEETPETSGVFYNFFQGVVFQNGKKSPFSRKEVVQALHQKTLNSPQIELRPQSQPQPAEFWEVQGKLTVHSHGNILFLSTNSLHWQHLAHSLQFLGGLGDWEEENAYHVHRHHDLWEASSKSEGITFYYWQQPASET